MNTSASVVAAAGFVLMAACGTKGSEKPVETSEPGKAGASVSQSADAASDRGASMVRFVNALPGAGPLEIVSDSVSIFSGVKFADVSSYKEVMGNIKKFSLKGAGQAGQLDANTEVMRDGGRYTMYAISDREGGVSLRIVRDDLTPEAGMARVRVLHAAPGVDDIDVTMDGAKDPLFDDVGYGDEAGFKDVAPVATGFVVRSADGSKALLTVKKMQLNANTAYTIVVTAKPGSKPSLVTFEDVLTGSAAQ
jgi:Domain of unknown function (DUF4397)